VKETARCSGSGRTELLRTLFGLDPVRSGRIRVAAWSPARWTPSDLLARGVGLLSEDRRHEGLAVDRSVQDNLLLGSLSEHARLGWLPSRSLHLTTLRWLNQLAVRARGPQQRVADLSGGNQQKIALARLLARDVDVLLLDEPTRGIDVGSKVQIYELIGALAAQGKAVLLVSSYFPELLGICDSIAVQHRGRLGDARPASHWSEHNLLLAATGVTEAAA